MSNKTTNKPGAISAAELTEIESVFRKNIRKGAEFALKKAMEYSQRSAAAILGRSREIAIAYRNATPDKGVTPRPPRLTRPAQKATAAPQPKKEKAQAPLPAAPSVPVPHLKWPTLEEFERATATLELDVYGVVDLKVDLDHHIARYAAIAASPYGPATSAAYQAALNQALVQIYQIDQAVAEAQKTALKEVAVQSVTSAAPKLEKKKKGVAAVQAISSEPAAAAS